jgi:imidazole glycerol-phosphate synthase subunit HisH
MEVAIIKYNAGNIRSVDFALRRLGIEASITDDHAEIMRADKVIFPGVGEASTTMSYLRDKGLDTLIKDLKQPVLGICLGLQLMCAHSEEGDTKCIGIFNLHVKKFQSGMKVPHMGWNSLHDLKGRMFDKSIKDEFVYFVHSYFAPCGVDTTAVTRYIIPFSAALERGNFYATQFHPEKSGPVGERILRKFIEL